MMEPVILSDRVRPNCEVAAWVHGEILAIEDTVAKQAREIDQLMETFAKVADFLNIDTEAARKAPGKPSDVFIAAMKAQPGAVPDERAAFIAEAKPFYIDFAWDHGQHRFYADHIQRAWHLWQARARLNSSRVPEGWQLVPLNPAKFLDMGFAYIDAARESEPNIRWAFSHAGYKAMLNAAPTSRLADYVVAPSFGSGTAPVEQAPSDVVKVPRELPAWLKDKHALGEKLYSIGWCDLADAQHCGVERLLEELQALLNGGRL
jgi:hypothetical protein